MRSQIHSKMEFCFSKYLKSSSLIVKRVTDNRRSLVLGHLIFCKHYSRTISLSSSTQLIRKKLDHATSSSWLVREEDDEINKSFTRWLQLMDWLVHLQEKSGYESEWSEVWKLHTSIHSKIISLIYIITMKRIWSTGSETRRPSPLFLF